MKELMEKKRVVDSLKAEVEKYNLIGLKSVEAQEKGRQLDSLADDLMKRIAEVEDLGITVRDIDFGLIDFPAERYGERVFLCWRYGEPEVSYWHRPEEGFAGRRTLNSQLISP